MMKPLTVTAFTITDQIFARHEYRVVTLEHPILLSGPRGLPSCRSQLGNVPRVKSRQP